MKDDQSESVEGLESKSGDGAGRLMDVWGGWRSETARPWVACCGKQDAKTHRLIITEGFRGNKHPD